MPALKVSDLKSLTPYTTLSRAFAEISNQDGADAENFCLNYYSNEELWNKFKTVVTTKLNTTGDDSFRVLVTIPDGTVIFDSAKDNNTHANAKNKAINENHNTRVAIMKALVGNGEAMEQKYSSTVNRKEIYLVRRIGLSTEESVGCVRISYTA